MNSDVIFSLFSVLFYAKYIVKFFSVYVFGNLIESIINQIESLMYQIFGLYIIRIILYLCYIINVYILVKKELIVKEEKTNYCLLTNINKDSECITKVFFIQ